MRAKLARPALKNKRTLFLFALLFIILVALLVWHSFSGPAQGSVNNSANMQSSSENRTVATTVYRAKNISFSYPASYQKRATQAPSGNVLENYDFNDVGYPSTDLVVAVYSLPSGNLEDNPAYLLRKQKPTQYQLGTWHIGSQNIPVYIDTTVGYSKVAFLLHGDKLATVALSGGSAVSVDESSQKMVLNSIKWNE